MDGTALTALAIHVLGFTFWVGGLFVLSLFMSAAGDEPVARARMGAVARKVARATDAAALLAIVGGVSLLTIRSWDLREPWMHMKLLFVVGLIAVHGLIRVRAKKLADGGPAPKPAAAIAVAGLAILIIGVIIFKPMGH